MKNLWNFFLIFVIVTIALALGISIWDALSGASYNQVVILLIGVTAAITFIAIVIAVLALIFSPPSADESDSEKKRRINQRSWISAGITLIILILVIGYVLFTMPIDRIVVVFIMFPLVIAVMALIISTLAMVVVPQIRSLRGITTSPVQKQREANSTQTLTDLARLIVVFTIGGIALIGFVIIQNAGETERSTVSSEFLATILPLFGSWVGTVLAYYYGRENFKAGVDATRPAGEEERLRSTPVRERMIEFDKIVKRNFPKDGGEKIQDILKDIKARANEAGVEDWYRLPIMDDEDRPYCIIHRSTLDQFRVDYALANPVTAPSTPPTATPATGGSSPKSVQDLTLADFINSGTGQALRVTSFAVIPESATLGDAKEAMGRINNCQDVLVTAKGTRNEKVVGWITNGIIEHASRV
jgi:hypothetical protein